MAVSTAKGSFAANTSTGDQSVSGLSFQPKALILWLTAQTAAGYTSSIFNSFGVATSSTQRWCNAWGSNNGAGTMTTASGIFTDRIVELYSDATTPTVDAVADFVSFNSDGFTINWSDAPTAAAIVHWYVVGGSDLTNLKAGTVTLATAGTPQAFTDPGFQPDFLMLFDARKTATGAAAGTPFFGLGMASGSGAQAACVVGDNDGSASAQTGVYQRSDSILLEIVVNATPIEAARGALNSLDATGFTIGFAALPTAAVICPYLAIKGGRHKVGVETQTTTPTTKVTSSLGVGPPRGLFLCGGNNAASASVQNVSAKLALGASDGTNEGAVWWSSTDAAANAECNTRTVTTKIISHSTNASTTDAEADMTTFADSSFTLDWTTADATAREFIYWAIGDNAAAQTARATADSVDGNWTDQADGTSLFEALDELSPSDTDYIKSETAPSASACRVKLGTLIDPASSTGHSISWRVSKSSGGATMNMLVTLRQGGGAVLGGGTQIAQFTRNGVPEAWTTYGETLSGAQADAITDYSDLYLEFSATEA